LTDSLEGVNEPDGLGVDSPTVSGNDQEERMTALLGGGLLSERMRQAHDGFAHEIRPVSFSPDGGVDAVSLASATQVEIDGAQVEFLVPFADKWPSEEWLHAFRRTRDRWPGHLTEPLLDEGRGLRVGPIPAETLEEHVRAVKDRVAAANRIYADEIEPELKRRRDEALRREQEELRIQAEVKARLKALLG
jgi:hypothetical protein